MKNRSFDLKISTKDRTLVSIKDFSFSTGKITFIFGESGIGKTLITKAIFGLLTEGELQITINGEDYPAYLEKNETSELRRNGFFMFQEPSTHLNPLMTLKDQLNEGSIAGDFNQAKIINDLWGKASSQKLNRILNTYPTPQIPSGGEKQRILAAMALKKIERLLNAGEATDKSIFVFDEPTGYLDNMHRNIFFNTLFEKYNRSNFTALVITHDYSIIGELFGSFNNLSDRFEFKEITSANDSLEINEFNPDSYLSWLNKLDNYQPADLISGGTDLPLMKIESGIEVYSTIIRFYESPSSEDPVPLTVRRGEISYLKGESGSGKTTVAKIMMGLLKAEKFIMQIDSTKLNEESDTDFWKNTVWGKKASMVFQHAEEALNINSKVKQIFDGLPIKSKPDNEILKENLSGLFNFEITKGFLNKKVRFLSGGEKQKLNIARSLVLKTDILILDEPISGMDWQGIKKFIELLRSRLTENRGILLISHYEDIFDRIIPRENHYYLRVEEEKE